VEETSSQEYVLDSGEPKNITYEHWRNEGTTYNQWSNRGRTYKEQWKQGAKKQGVGRARLQGDGSTRENENKSDESVSKASFGSGKVKST